MRIKRMTALICAVLCLSGPSGLSEGVYTEPMTIPVSSSPRGGTMTETLSESKAPMEYWSDLMVGEVSCRMSEDGKTMFIHRPEISGGTGRYTIAYNIYDSDGNAINYFYSDEADVAATCPYNGIFNVFVVVNDGRASKTVMTGWFEVSAYVSLEIGEIRWQMSRDGRSCFIQKPAIRGAEGLVSIAYNIYDADGNAVNYFYSDAEAVAATCPRDGIYNVYVVVRDEGQHSVIGMTGWFYVNGYHGVISADDHLNGGFVTVGESVEWTVLTAPTVSVLGLFRDDGEKLMVWSSGYTDEDDVRIWRVRYPMTQAGKWQGSLQASVDGTAFTSPYKVTVDVSDLPGIISVQTGEETLMVGNTLTLTVHTPVSAGVLGFFDGDGTMLQRYEAETSAVRQGVEATWSIGLPLEQAGEMTLTIKVAAEDEAWAEEHSWHMTMQVAPRNVDGFTFRLEEDEAIITGYIGSETELLLPDEADGCPVTALDDRALAELTGVETITLPESVTVIGAEAFAGCTALKRVSMYDTVTQIGDYAFDGCVSLKSVLIAD